MVDGCSRRRIAWRRTSCSSRCEAGCCASASSRPRPGRLSPYFFNAGLFDDGAKLGRLARILCTPAARQRASAFDMLFGPAYKGIPLAAAVAIELARRGRNVPFAYNRKEAKDHGEGGTLVGAPVAGRVLIVDDVMSAGTAVRESIALIRAAGATPHARGDRAGPPGTAGGATDQDVACSAVQYVTDELRLDVGRRLRRWPTCCSICSSPTTRVLQAHALPVQRYRERYGV